MITNISLTSVYCLDQDATRDFYVDVLGFRPHTDVTWAMVTAGSPLSTQTSPSSKSP